ncbi:MAG TPA: ABC transporter ATP-binding protein, partial [Bacillota bacterium]|nr:ABC transporter ATP-binding protein [Bacillota bacterium]
GKSTLLRTIMGMLDKKKGTIQVCGHDLDTSFIDYKKQIAYLPEEPMLLSELTVYQHFQMYGLAYGISEETLTKRIETYVEGFELTGKLDKYPEELSKGMRQKVQGICAFLPDAPLLLIDEPFMGLDIYAIDYIEELMRQKISEGVTIFISSHQLERIRDLADSFILLQKGEVIRQGPINEFDTIKRGSDT